jgi:hypothetical protein
MKTILLLPLFAVLSSAPAFAQQLNLNLDSLAAKASDKTELTLEGPMLAFVKTAIAKKAGPDAQGLFDNVAGISIHNYEFGETGKYSDTDLASLRAQVSTARGWSRVIKSKDSHDDTEVYVLIQGGQARAFLLIDAEPKELSVVQISGTLELARMQQLINSTVRYVGPSQAGIGHQAVEIHHAHSTDSSVLSTR